MKFVSYNIQYGKGKDGHFDLERIADEVAGGDVIALQEVERFWKRSGEQDQPAALAQLLRSFHWVYGANLDMHTSVMDDEGYPVHRRRQFGTMILSRAPILSSRNFPLPKRGTLTQHSIQQGLLEAVIETPKGRCLRVYSVHLSHLSPMTRVPQIEAILSQHKSAPSEGGAWCGGHPNESEGWTEGEMPPMPAEAVLMGDFNFEPDSEEYAQLVGPLSAEFGRLNALEGFVDSWVAAGHSEKTGVSCDGKRIDYIFVSASLSALARAAHIDEAATGSDHQPTWLDLDV